MQGVKPREFFMLRRSYEYNIYEGPQVEARLPRSFLGSPPNWSLTKKKGVVAVSGHNFRNNYMKYS